MLMIRLARVGRKNLPSYRIVVQEKSFATSSSVVENVGQYDPKTEPSTVTIKKERIEHWIKQGARPSLRVAEILVGQDILKLDQVPELKDERARREAGKKRQTEKLAWKKKVTQEIKKRGETKQKASEKPAPEKPAEEAKAEEKPTDAPTSAPVEEKKETPAAPAEEKKEEDSGDSKESK